MNKNQSAPKSDVLTFLIAFILAAFMIVAGVLLRRVLWPAIKWGATKAWAFARNKNSNQTAKAEKNDFPTLDLPSSALPTPDIFKGAINLGPMQEFKLK